MHERLNVFDRDNVVNMEIHKKPLYCEIAFGFIDPKEQEAEIILKSGGQGVGSHTRLQSTFLTVGVGLNIGLNS
jgi:hypothetical protein